LTEDILFRTVAGNFLFLGIQTNPVQIEPV